MDTNNETIIDGVDVSRCDSYTSNYREPMPYGEIKVTKHYCWHINSNCDGKDCDFKQIKRLQAENEQIKKDYAKLHIDFAKCNEENERLKAENKHLTEKEKEAKHYLQEAYKFHQAMQEIRDMATLFHSVNENKGLDRFKNNILNKINSVIGAE